MRNSIIVPLVVLFLASAAFAQSPQLLVKNPDKTGDKPHPIALAKADVQLLLAGPLCQTTMTLTFSNDVNRVLEGELVFPLPENATISAYALDVGGQLVESVTVEKEKARAIFETEVRKGVDPGMIEQVAGNNFRTRIYPIPANGSRTIRVQYVSQATSKDGQLVYPLPLHWPGSSPELSLRIESISKDAPVVANVDGLTFKTDGGKQVAEARFEKASFAGDLVATLPAVAAAESIVEKHVHSTVSVENIDPKTIDQFTKTDYYFIASDLPAIDPQTTTATRAKPGRIAIAWDASLSRGHVDHKKEFELISKHLAELGDVGVELTVFRNVPEATKGFRIEKGDASALISYLSAVAYDGGTNLSAVGFTRETAGERKADMSKTPPAIGYYLLFTDGLSNLGAEMPATIEVPLFAVSNDPTSNYALLRRISSTSGGQFINLQTLSGEQAQATISDAPFSLISIDCDPKEITDVYPRLPLAVQGRVTVAGKLLNKSAKLTLNYGRGGVVSRRVPMTISQDAAVDANAAGGTPATQLVSRYWAQLKLADLAYAIDKNESKITALGKQFNLVTPFTSMIVLETVEQYLQHKIIPPKSRAEIYSEFMKRIEQNQAIAQKEDTAKIDRVLAMWNARQTWWNQEFKYAADFKYQAPKEAKDVAAASTLGVDVQSGGVRSAGGRVAEGRPTDGAVASDPRPNAPAPHPTAEPDSRTPTPTNGTVTARVYDIRDLQTEVPEFGRQESGSGNGRPMTQAGRLALYRPDSAPQKIGGKPIAEFDETLIAIKPWSPDSAYIKALQSAAPDQAYTIYLKERNSYESSPAFYLDCADFFAKTNPDLALRILTNIPELALDDGRLIRIAAHRLQQLGQIDLAIDLFEKVSHLRPEEPQSFRDLALALADRAEQRMAVLDIRDFPIEASRPAVADYQRALELLHKVVMNQWQRFDEIEVIALTEANRIIARMNTFPEAVRTTNPFDPRLIKLLDPDLRIVMTWDTDNTDIDLHVTEPTGETCVYNHNRTTIGGALSKDFTQGYGPEEYMLKKLMPGEYKIQAHFYGNRDQKLIGPTTVQATIITHFGRPDEKRQAITLRLKDAKEMVDIGTVTLK